MTNRATILSLAILAAISAAGEGVLRTARDLNAFLDGNDAGQREFALEGRISYRAGHAVVVEDASGRVYCLNLRGEPPPCGSRVKAFGAATRPEPDDSVPFLLRNEPSISCRRIEVLSAGDEPEPASIRLADIDPERFHLRFLRVRGLVMDAVEDDIDPDYAVLLLRDGDSTLPVAVQREGRDDVKTLVDAEIEVSGLFWNNLSSKRKFTGPMLTVATTDKLTVLAAPPDDLFAAPPLETLRYVSPTEVARLGRRTVRGRVLAVYGRNKLMVATDDGRTVSVELAGDAAPPECGSYVAISGRPRTNLWQIKLATSVWRAETPPQGKAAPSLDDRGVQKTAMIEDIMKRRDDGRMFYNLEYNGFPVSATGEVISLPPPGDADGLMLVDCGDFVATVDAGAHPGAYDGVELGCRVRVSGICIMDGPSWSAENIFPRIENCRIVVRGKADVAVVRRPPWWTTGRLACAVAFLLAVVAGVLVWNRALTRLAVRRGRELIREQIGRERATLRIGERTRLAVELHDSLSQCLGGLACQLSAAKTLASLDPAKAERCLGAAERMLQSSRTELQRCIFDLRGDTLGEADFSKALRKAVSPIAGDAHVEIDLDVNRAHLSDSVAHAAICVVRELVSNAIRHGGATTVWISGENRERAISLVVRDNGRGFDTRRRPGPQDGHFGIEGIRERVRRLDGAFEIESAPDKGTVARVRLSLDGEKR